MRAIKALQFMTILQVAVILGFGIATLFTDRWQMEDFRIMIGVVGPFIVLQIGSAFGGTPLKKLLENARAKIDNGTGHGQ